MVCYFRFSIGNICYRFFDGRITLSKKCFKYWEAISAKFAVN
jgi:hypothetical protein